MRHLAVFVVLAALVWGCSSDFEPQGLLGEDARPMAVVAEPPEVRAGDEVRLLLWLHDPSGSMHVAWLRCVPYPGEPVERCPSTRMEILGLDAPPPCTSDTPVPCVMGDGPDATDVVPPNPFQKERYMVYYYFIAAESDDPVGACTGFMNVPPVPDPGCLVGIKRVVVTDEPRNENPVIWGFLVDGTPTAEATAVLSQDTHTIEIVPLASSLDELSPQEPVFYPVQWFTTCPSMSFYDSTIKCFYNDLDALECEYAAPTVDLSDATSPCDVYAVLRDNLGGVDVRRLTVEPDQ